MKGSDTESLFKEKNVTISVPHKKVTWFNILNWERDMNANQGGWDFKEDDIWKKRALNWMSVEGIRSGKEQPSPVVQWTKASTSIPPDRKPIPRTDKFMLIRSDKPIDQLSRGSLKNDISNVDDTECGKLSENQLNWSCYLYGRTELSRDVTWGYEVPLAAESSGQLKVDLLRIARVGEVADVEIVELKNADGANSPVEALVQSICYLCQLSRCWESLTKPEEATSLKGVQWKNASVRLILAAPDAYWSKWKCTKNEAGPMRRIVETVGDALEGDNRPNKLELTFANVDKTEDGKYCRLRWKKDFGGFEPGEDSILSH